MEKKKQKQETAKEYNTRMDWEEALKEAKEEKQKEKSWNKWLNGFPLTQEDKKNIIKKQEEIKRE